MKIRFPYGSRFVSAAILAVLITGLCLPAAATQAESVFLTRAQAVINTGDSQQIQAQLAEWQDKVTACNPETPSQECQKLLEAIALLQNALTRD